jgi:L-rhamnose mutarotase
VRRRVAATPLQDVRGLLARYHLWNFNIFLRQLPDGRWYEFGYYEYTGTDFAADMAALDREPRNIEWHELCDPMQIPLLGASGWREMEAIYLNE